MATSRRGFTLVELLLYAGIFSIVAVVFIGIMITMLRIQSRESAGSEVAGQSQFLLGAVQNYVEQSSYVDMTTDAATSTMRLRMGASSTDPTIMYLSNGAVFLQQGAGAAQQLTSNRVSVTNLQFAKRANAGGHDLVSVAFSISYKSGSPLSAFGTQLDTSIARVSAATFDSGVFPAATSSVFKLGASGQAWQSVNDVLYFNGTNVGVNVTNPAQALEINGGLRLNTAISQPTCVGVQVSRGMLWFTQGGAGKDTLQVCAQNASGTLGWQTLY